MDTGREEGADNEQARNTEIFAHVELAMANLKPSVVFFGVISLDLIR
jgi:hypothetical protein